jgi:hypothetical protein
MTGERTTRKPRALWLQADLITAFFSALIIRINASGRLAHPPTLDDVSYR